MKSNPSLAESRDRIIEMARKAAQEPLVRRVYSLEDVGKDDLRVAEVAAETIAQRGEAKRAYYTDGSARDGVSKGGYAVVRDDGETRMGPAGIHVSSFRTEVMAMKEAFEWIKESEDAASIIFTDSRSIVTALKNPHRNVLNRRVQELKQGILDIPNGREIHVQWIPSRH